MKILIFSACIIGMIGSVQAQTAAPLDKYIEVKVKDTIMVSPDYVEAFVKLKEDYSSVGDLFYDDSDKKASSQLEKVAKMSKEKEELEKAIAYISSSYKYNDKATSNFLGKEMDLWNDGYVVTMKNTEQYTALIAALAKFDDVSVSLKTMEIRNKDIYDSRLMDKAMKAANKEAALIAQSMNVILDKAISVKNYDASAINYGDISGENANASNYMSALYAMMGNMFQAKSDLKSVSLAKTLIVRYIYK